MVGRRAMGELKHLERQLLDAASFRNTCSYTRNVAKVIVIQIYDCKSSLAVLHKSVISSAAGSARVKPAD